MADSPDSSNTNDNESDLELGRDFYIDPATGFTVMTAEYLLKRGYCCNNSCRHCPYPKNSQ